MAIAAQIQVTDQDVRTTSTTQGGELVGQIAPSSDGRVWVYSANASTSVALSPGKLTQGAATVANHLNRTGTVQTAGTLTVPVAVGATAVTQDQYKGGYFVVNKGTGAGQALLIIGNNAAATSGTTTVILKDALITSTDATSKFSLYPNVFSANLLYVHAAPTATVPTGVPAISIAAATTANPGNYYWSQVGGETSVLADAATWVAPFDGVIPSTLTDGAVGIQAAATVQPTIGYSLDTLVSTEYRPVMLTGVIR